ncbi:MAG TPA: LdpA C-terminal domain-containing domain, partial [Candidatus Obscuribacterales bacterium]
GGTNNHTVAKLQAAGLLNKTINNEQKEGRRRNTKGVEAPPSPLPFTPSPFISGVAYGSYARRLLSPVLDRLENINSNQTDANTQLIKSPQLSGRLEETPPLLWDAVAQAHSLVSQLKSSVKGKITHSG